MHINPVDCEWDWSVKADPLRQFVRHRSSHYDDVVERHTQP